MKRSIEDVRRDAAAAVKRPSVQFVQAPLPQLTRTHRVTLFGSRWLVRTRGDEALLIGGPSNQVRIPFRSRPAFDKHTVDLPNLEMFGVFDEGSSVDEIIEWYDVNFKAWLVRQTLDAFATQQLHHGWTDFAERLALRLRSKLRLDGFEVSRTVNLRDGYFVRILMYEDKRLLDFAEVYIADPHFQKCAAANS